MFTARGRMSGDGRRRARGGASVRGAVNEAGHTSVPKPPFDHSQLTDPPFLPDQRAMHRHRAAYAALALPCRSAGVGGDSDSASAPAATPATSVCWSPRVKLK